MKLIASALVKARRSFGPALKDKTNPAFRSKYADLAACIEAVDDALLAQGIALMQETFEDSTGVTIETVFLHESGESIRCGKLHVPATKQDAQGFGSAMTYARRYSLLAACGMAPEDDDGNAASKPRGKVVEAFRDTPKEDAFNGLQPEIQDFLRRAAQQVVAAMPDAAKAVDILTMAIETWPDEDSAQLKIAAWSLLDSKTRAAIKTYETARRAA